MAGQVQIEGSPEWQAYKNAELAFIAPSVGPTPINYAQSALNHVAPSSGPAPVSYVQAQLDWQQAQLVHQQQALNFVAGRRKREADWQTAFVAGGNPNWQQNFASNNGQSWQQAWHAGYDRSWEDSYVAGHGRKKRHVSVVGSPEWQAYKQAELNFIAPSHGPTPGNNFAQAQLNWQHANNVHQAQAAAFVAGHGRRKRQVSVVGSPEWQAYKQAELAWQHQQAVHQANAAAFVAGHGRRKRQVQVIGSPEWQAYKNAELAFIAPSVGPTPVNYAQSELNHIAPSPGPTPVNYAQAVLNHQQAALNFIAG